MEARCCFTFAVNFLAGYTCWVEILTRSGPGNDIIAFTGKHQSGKTDNDVNKLTIESKLVSCFPRNLHKKFPNLQELSIMDCGLEEISRQDVIGLENLECINLSSNKIVSLPDDLFVGFKNMKKIIFTNNRLEFFNSKLLLPIKNTLQRADFMGNPKINEYFDITCLGYNNNDLEKLMRNIDLNCTPPEPQANTTQKASIEVETIPAKKNDDEKDRIIEKFQKMHLKMEQFQSTGTFSDFTIKVFGNEFKVHKNVLASQCPVFEAMFTNDTDEAAKTFTKVQNFTEKGFKSFLDYFYTGKIDAEVNVTDMFELASEFDVSDLKETCILRIIENLSDLNALEVFNLGHQHNSGELKQPAFEIIKKMFPDMDESFVNEPEDVNSLVEAKRQIEAILKSKKK